MKELTVEKAIKRGQILINIPVIVLFIIGLIGSLILFAKFENFLILILGIPFTFIAMWILWSYIVAEWKIWSYSNCRNVHELKRKAINSQLIGDEGSKWARLEYRTHRQKELLNSLMENFKIADIEIEVFDDGTLPEVLEIHYSKISNAVVWSSILFTIGFGIYAIYNQQLYGYVILPAASFYMYYTLKNPKTNEPHITLSKDGIKLFGNSFVSWSNLKEEEIKLIGLGGSSKWHLHITLRNKNYQQIEINDLTEPPKRIEKLVKIYKQRNKNNR
jgi:hypothetical protein